MSSSSNQTDQADAFFEGHGIAVELAEVEDALDRLWGPAAEKAGGPELEHPAVTRVALANVVLVNLGGDRPELAETIEAITSQYPSRLILLRGSAAQERRLAAEVSAHCHLPAPGRPQVCSEQIVLRASPDGRDLLPGAVRPLLESDLHSVLWWCDDPREAPRLLASLAEGATRVILDLPDPAADPAGLAEGLQIGPDGLVRDIAWFGLTPWREMIAQLFDPPASTDLDRIAEVRVRARAEPSGSETNRPPRAAAWLIAWLAGQLGWVPVGAPRSDGPGRLSAELRGPTGAIAVTIETEQASVGPLARITGVELALRANDRPGGTLRIGCAGPECREVRIESQDRPCAPLPRFVIAPEYDTARLVSAALLTDRNDPPYRRASPVALWLLGQADESAAKDQGDNRNAT